MKLIRMPMLNSCQWKLEVRASQMIKRTKEVKEVFSLMECFVKPLCHLYMSFLE